MGQILKEQTILQQCLMDIQMRSRVWPRYLSMRISFDQIFVWLVWLRTAWLTGVQIHQTIDWFWESKTQVNYFSWPMELFVDFVSIEWVALLFVLHVNVCSVCMHAAALILSTWRRFPTFKQSIDLMLGNIQHQTTCELHANFAYCIGFCLCFVLFSWLWCIYALTVVRFVCVFIQPWLIS